MHFHFHHHHHHLPECAAAPADPCRECGGAVKAPTRVFVLGIVLNLLFVVVEAVVGWREGSMSLLSDAGHNLSDVFSLALVLLSFFLASVARSRSYTYGLRKSTVLVSLANALMLLGAVGVIVWQSVARLVEPDMVNGAAVSWTALAGIAVNGLTVALLTAGRKGDINVRGAFLHMLADTLVSVGVVVSGLAISLTGLYIIDPIVSLLIAAMILAGTWRLLCESVRLALDGAPCGVDVEALTAALAAVPHVADVHHVHVWALSTTENALTCHVATDDIGLMETTKRALRAAAAAHGVGHCTLEFEVG